jgi:RNA polymerase sigma factor (sigma-70 family)
VAPRRSPPTERTERDDEDARLIAAGDYGTLLAAYYPTILLRLRLRRLPLVEAEDVRQRVVEHLLRELRGGKTYSVPFRVVVHQRTTWELLDYHAEQKRRQVEVADEQENASTEDLERADANLDFDFLVEGLTDRERQAVVLRWREGLEVPQIAEVMGVEANAVHQTLFRAHRKVRKRLG